MSSDQHHIIPLRTYLNIAMALLGLTIVTVWVAQYDLGPVNLVVAMLIAVTKGTLVAMFFMHLKYTNKLYATVFIGALLMLAVFIVFTMFDTMSRGDIYAIKNGPINDRAIIYGHDSTTAAPADTAFETPAVDSAMLDTGH
jgi:cytochrome c oxidase subunit 4